MIFLWILAGLFALLILYILFLVVCSLLVDPKRDYTRYNGFYRRILEDVTNIALWIMRIRVHTQGLDQVPEGRVLLVGNHRSCFDPIVTWRAFKKWTPAFISKPENFKIPVFGRIIRRCCFLAIDRENPRNAIRTIQTAAKLMVDDQVSVGVYPEGTRSKNCVLLPFHDGVFKIAQKAKVPIVVVAIEGSENVHKNYPWHRTHVQLSVLEVIPAAEVCEASTHALGQRVRSLLEQKLGQTQ